MFGRKELIAVTVSIIIFSFVFGFNDGKSGFDFGYWGLNFIRVFLVVTISVLLRELVIKLVARKKGCSSTYEIWNLKRYWFFEWNKLGKGVPVASIFAIFLTLITNGKAYFTAIGKNVIKADRNLRVGRKFTRLTGYDESLILSSGIITTAFLVVLFSFINKITWVDFSLMIGINFWLTLWGLLPFPSLNAGRMFVGSRNYFVFVLAFVVALFALKDLNIILNLILSVLCAGVLLAVYYYFLEY